MDIKVSTKDITNLINLGAQIASAPDEHKAIILLKSWGLNSSDTEALVKMLCAKCKQESTYSCKYFYWEPMEGKRVYRKLQEAAVDTRLNEETRYVAKALLSDGSPSIMGYSLRMNNFYMEHFIYIMTSAE